jgi:hypothetical protein
MTTLQRVLPPISVGKQTIKIHGRIYNAAPGSTLDVPDFDAGVLMANGWLIADRVRGAGPTTSRPTTSPPGQFPGQPLPAGYSFLDTTLGYVVVWDGNAWRSPATGAAV